MNEAIRDWITNVQSTHYLIGSAAGPHPYPMLVRDLQAVIGRETREQILEREGRLPDALVACVGGGSNAIGLFHAFLDDAGVRLLGAEAGGDERGARRHPLPGPGVGPARLSQLRARRRGWPGAGEPLHLGRAGLPRRRPRALLPEAVRPGRYAPVSDAEALAAFHLLSRREGIIPALESAHAIALALREARAGELVVVGLSGRGDKDVDAVEGGRWSLNGRCSRST